MALISGLAKIFDYFFFTRLNTLISRLISASINQKLKKTDGNAKFQYPLKLEGAEFIQIGKGFSSGKGLRMQAITKYRQYSFSPIIKIGDNVTINPNCQIASINEIEIGNDVLIASYVFISDHSHGKSDLTDIDTRPADRMLYSKGPIKIGNNTWIGQGVSILSNVNIGENVIIGANSVIVKDIPDNAVVAGVPGKIIKFSK